MISSVEAPRPEEVEQSEVNLDPQVLRTILDFVSSALLQRDSRGRIPHGTKIDTMRHVIAAGGVDALKGNPELKHQYMAVASAPNK